MLKMSKNGQVTISKEARSLFGIDVGDYLQEFITPEGILLRPVEVTPKRIPISEIVEQAEKEIAQGKHVTLSSDADIERLIDGL